MHTNRRNLLDIGNMHLGKFITADQLERVYTNPEQKLTEILRTFSYQDALVTLSRINLLFHRSSNLLEDERILKVAFCNIAMLNKIDASAELRVNFIFNRQATLRLLDKCVYLSDPDSARTFDRNDARNDLTESYLLVNGLLDAASPNLNRQKDNEGENSLLVATIPSWEYAVNSSPEYKIKRLMVRTEEFWYRLQAELSVLDVHEIFYQATGLTFQHYHRLIYLIFAFYWKFTPEEICRQDSSEDRSLFFNPNGQSDELTPLYEKLLPHICVSIDELRNIAEEHPQVEDEFRLWRKYPLVKISENQTICVDFSFLFDKLQTGALWIVRDYLRYSEDNGRFMKLWGDIFQDYAASVIERGVNSENTLSRESLIIGPKYNQKQSDECTDVAVCCDDTLILLECKATLLSAQAKFGGNFNEFDNNIPSVKKGIKQLSKSIRMLGNIHKSERLAVEGIDISKVKKIYPILVLSDHIFAAPLMNRFFDSEFQKIMQRISLIKHLEVMPLTVLTIMDLESLAPYMSDKPFYAHLDEWLDWFKENRYLLGFTAYLYNLISNDTREDPFMDTRFDRITSDVMDYFTSRGIV